MYHLLSVIGTYLKYKVNSWYAIYLSMCIRPDFNDLLFLGSFPWPFHRTERDKKKLNNRKNRQKNAFKYKICRKVTYFLKHIWCFPQFVYIFLRINLQEYPRNNKSIEYGLWGCSEMITGGRVVVDDLWFCASQI